MNWTLSIREGLINKNSLYREIYAILPRLHSKIGHIFHYHISVQKATQSINWNYFAFVPKKIKIAPLPSQWIPVLANDISEVPKNIFMKLKVLFGNIIPFWKICRDIEINKNAILFIEHFEMQHIASLIIALFFLKPKFHFWLLHRYDFENKKMKVTVFRCFKWCLHKKFGEENIRFLTDSELLAGILKPVLKCPIAVVPIPHTERTMPTLRDKRSNFLLWWPGGLIREDKGLFKVQELVKQMQIIPEARIAMAEKARSLFLIQNQLIFIPTVLSREEYMEWMQRASLVLLPYSSDYSYRTSGIFVEVIISGAIPVTTRGTWMAHELNRFELSELIFDWNELDLISNLKKISVNQNIKRKLEIMQKQYSQYHSEEGFANAMTSLRDCEKTYSQSLISSGVC